MSSSSFLFPKTIKLTSFIYLKRRHTERKFFRAIRLPNYLKRIQSQLYYGSYNMATRGYGISTKWFFTTKTFRRRRLSTSRKPLLRLFQPSHSVQSVHPVQHVAGIPPPRWHRRSFESVRVRWHTRCPHESHCQSTQHASYAPDHYTDCHCQR